MENNHKNLVPYIEREDELEESIRTVDFFVNSPDLKKCLMVFSGASGTGKSFLVDHLKEHLECGMTSAIGADGLTRFDFEGMKEIEKDGSTYWNDGIIPQAIKEANKDGVHILKVEEFNHMPPDTQACLNSVLDKQAEITLIANNGQKVEVDYGCTLIIILTINEGYKGDFGIQESVKSRQDYQYGFEFGDAEFEGRIIKTNTGIPENLAIRIAKFGEELRRAYHKADRSVDQLVTTRGLISIARLTKAGLKPKNVVKCAVANKLSVEQEKREMVVKIAEGQNLLNNISEYQEQLNSSYEEEEEEEEERNGTRQTKIKEDKEEDDVLSVERHELYTFKEEKEIPDKIEYLGNIYPFERKGTHYKNDICMRVLRGKLKIIKNGTDPKKRTYRTIPVGINISNG